jgi:hypothetical protein
LLQSGMTGVEDRSGDRAAVGVNWLGRCPIPDRITIALAVGSQVS